MDSYLNIVVTHYNEPWEVGKPFFDMIEYQQCAELDKVAVTLVQDGEDTALPWDTLLSQYSYDVQVLTLPQHAGPAAARNIALEHCLSDWIMFCSFDDIFADVCTLNMIFQNLPTTEYDVIWCKIARQAKWYGKYLYINCDDNPNFSNTDGKMYRVDFLREHNISFPYSPRLYYEHMFNAVVIASTEPFRIAKLTTNFYPYFKRFNPNGIKHTVEAYDELARTALERDIKIARFFKHRGWDFAYRRNVAKAVCTEYYSTYAPDLGKNDKDTYTPGFIDFYRKNRSAFESIKSVDMDAILSEAEVEQLNIIQTRYNEHKQEFYFKHDDITFPQWIDKLNKLLSQPQQVAQNEQPVPAPQRPERQQNGPDVCVIDNSPRIVDTEPQREPRVVVYCGTYDVYMNMVASCKSLLCNTPVDKVYFLIEDDTFPYDIPDIVTTINVKNQTYFPADGPNYNNSWTWMCMIRAAFPEIFSQYKKILSLDIDVVISDNVSDLWDYDISDYYLAGVPERQRQKSTSDPLYINFGVVMMNLDKLRRDNIQPKLIDALNTRKLGCPEQDAYNNICAWHILDLPNDYNYTSYSHITGDAQNVRIVHYAGQKSWRHYSNVKQYADLGWNEVMRRQSALKGGK
jgi:hypothetical protein